MFLPLLTQSQVSNGSKMKGMVVEVWTNDDQRFLYVITQVRRHVAAASAFDAPFSATTDQVWLQTSEGKGTQPKLQVVADLLSQEAADHDAANPVPHPHAPTVDRRSRSLPTVRLAAARASSAGSGRRPARRCRPRRAVRSGRARRGP